jgi:hypothetical protein
MINRKIFAVLGLALASLFVLSDAHASDLDQATKLTFSQPIQIPGKVLPAGTYWFVVLTPNAVRIFNSDESMVIATLLTNPAEVLKPADKTTVTFADRGSMQPAAIVTWFYPGRLEGHQFMYSNQERKEIAQATLHTVASGD